MTRLRWEDGTSRHRRHLQGFVCCDPEKPNWRRPEEHGELWARGAKRARQTRWGISSRPSMTRPTSGRWRRYSPFKIHEDDKGAVVARRADQLEPGLARRPWWKKKRFVIPLALLLFFGVIGQMAGSGEQQQAAPTAAATAAATRAPEPTKAAEPTKAPEQPAEPEVPAEHQAALEKAQMYSDTMNMSKAKLRDQLTSDYGEGFPKAAADYAIANVQADWKANARVKARSYRETMKMSNSSIREQLVSEYGEQFTKAEADWAMANLEK